MKLILKLNFANNGNEFKQKRTTMRKNLKKSSKENSIFKEPKSSAAQEERKIERDERNGKLNRAIK